jgi:hypothetical protein
MMNLPVIHDEYKSMISWTPEKKEVGGWNGKTQVFAGRKSEYIVKERLDEFGLYF